MAAFLSLYPSHVCAQTKLKLSIAKTFVHDELPVFIEIAVSEFKIVMKDTIGMEGDVGIKYSPAELAAKINDRQLDFGILHAHEFAWVQKKYPDLQPLLIAATKPAEKHVHVIVHKDDPAKTFADLRGKKFDQALSTKEYCLLHLQKLCTGENTADASKYFGSIARSATAFEALDQVARRKADVTIIDSIRLESYKEIKGPVFEKNLRVLEQSSVVPPAVVIYRKDALSQETVDRVRNGLLKAHTTTRGKILMAIWQIQNFDAVPKDYGDRLAAVLKEYPAPESPR
jgi:ABC-type phosphate/phosphonate transport system substrate-binding protein